MPSIIFVIYSGHKAREKSKLESEAKKRQKERAQRGTGDGAGGTSARSAPGNQSTTAFAPSASSDIKTPKNSKPEPVTVATQTNFQDEKQPRKPNSDGRQSSASNRDRTDRYRPVSDLASIVEYNQNIK